MNRKVHGLFVSRSYFTPSRYIIRYMVGARRPEANLRPPLIILIGCVLSFSAFAQEPAQVIHADADWRVSGHAPQSGERIKFGMELRSSATGELLLHCGRQGIIAYSCKNQSCAVQACSTQGQNVTAKMIEAKSAGINASSSALSGILDGVFYRRPRAPIIAASRAGGGPSDAVLLQDSKGIHWGPMISRVLEGRYCFRVSPLRSENKSQPATFNLAWDREADADAAVAVTGLTAGSYQIETGVPSGANCAVDPSTVPAWVLITSSSRFQHAAADWKEGQTGLANLQSGGLTLAAAESLRRLLLMSIENSLDSR